MKKICVHHLIIVIGVMCLIGRINIAEASELEKGEGHQVITELTEEEEKASREKLKKAEEYLKSKSEKGERAIKTVAVKTAMQIYGNYCGPATAYNATNGKISQESAAKLFAIYPNQGSTSFPGNWKNIMDGWRPGNNYTALKASGYTLNSWKSKLKSSIIYTIDKGYPVIADCKIIGKDSGTWIDKSYSYTTSSWHSGTTYHYVTVAGYNTTNNKMYVVDSNNRKGVPRTYWSELDKLAKATNPLGIVW